MFRATGLAFILGGLLYGSGWLLFATLDPDHNMYAAGHWLPLNVMIIIGTIFIAFGLPGFHAFQQESTGVVGLVGVSLLFLGMLLAGAVGQAVETFALPHFGSMPPASRMVFAVAGPLFFVGLVITGLTTWHSGAVPGWSGLAIIGAALVGLAATYIAVPPLVRWGNPALFAAVIAYWGFFILTHLPDSRQEVRSAP